MSVTPASKIFGDVRMVHHRERLPLGLEPGDDLPAVHAQLDDLEGDAAFDRLALLGHPDFAEAAFADLFQQLVAADHLGRGFLGGGFDDDGGPLSLQGRVPPGGCRWKNVPSATRPPCGGE